MSFDYARAISLNQAALRRVVVEIYVWLELVLDGSIKTLPLALQQAAYRLLVPAESALRRLIIIAARGLKVDLPERKPMPKGQSIAAKGTRALSFQLYDVRKRFDRKVKPQFVIPRISFFDGPTLVTIAAPKTKKQLTSNRILRRFEAFKLALENIPYQAKRMARWQVRRVRLKEPKFTDPLRLGAPPGFRRKLIFDVDRVLKECHGLAFDALKDAPS